MSDTGDVKIEVNGRWVDLNEWLATDATAEQAERIMGKGNGSWVATRVDMGRVAADTWQGIVDGVAAGFSAIASLGLSTTEVGEIADDVAKGMRIE